MKDCEPCEGTGNITLESNGDREDCGWCGGTGQRAPALGGATIRGHAENRGHFGRFWMIYLVIFILLLAVASLSLALTRIAWSDVDTSGFRETGPATATPADPTATARPSSKTGGAATRFGEGTLLVGKDIKAGRYRASVPNGTMEFGCYWQRMKGVTGEPSDIIANGFTSPGGKATVEIRPGDVAFESHGCGEWTRA